jgi:hypothetical protein
MAPLDASPFAPDHNDPFLLEFIPATIAGCPTPPISCVVSWVP